MARASQVPEINVVLGADVVTDNGNSGCACQHSGLGFQFGKGGEQLRNDCLGLIAIMNVLRIVNGRRLLQGGMACRWLFGEC